MNELPEIHSLLAEISVLLSTNKSKDKRVAIAKLTRVSDIALTLGHTLGMRPGG